MKKFISNVFWKISFGGTCSKSENGAGIVLKITQYGIYSYDIIL